MNHVLIVDDNSENLHALEGLLRDHGFRVTTSAHGADALARARNEAPDLVISDLLMPVMDGFSLLRHWKADARLAAIPFVVFTATYGAPDDERLARSLGADDFMSKTSAPDEVLARLRSLTSAPQGGRTARPTATPPAEPDLLNVFSQSLVRKLEEKSLLLEETNRALQREITERRRLIDTQASTLDALRESEERFRQLAETISEVFWISDPTKTRMLYVSPAYAVIWGRSPEELYADPEKWLDAIHPDDLALVHSALPGQERGEYDIAYRIVRPDGSLRWIRDRAFPVQDASGAVYRIVGIAEDVTSQRTNEAQLLRAQRMESIGTLAGGIAHDLNNVLTPILMSIELLRLDLPAAERSETLASIEGSAQKGAAMVRQLLSFARGVEGRREVVRVERILSDIERIVRDTFMKTIRVQCTVEEGVPPVLGDPTQLHQVLLNLCVNARDAMPSGGSIALSASRRVVGAAQVFGHDGVAPGTFVALEVRDTGEGIPGDVLDRIFEPFFTTKDVGLGTGLGLSTSMAIVRSFGGFIEVRSVVGEGSTFVVYMPVADENAIAEAPASSPPLLRGDGELVLVVDDETAIRDITRRSLEAFGYRVLLAADGAEALALFARHSADVAVVITDLMMPVLDGAIAIRAIRRLSATVPIIVVSGVEPDAAAGSVLRATEGTLRQLQKPYRADELLRVLYEVLHSAHSS